MIGKRFFAQFKMGKTLLCCVKCTNAFTPLTVLQLYHSGNFCWWRNHRRAAANKWPTLPLNICIEYTSIWARIKLTTTICMKHESPNMKCQVHGIKIVRSFHVKWLCFPFRRSQPQWFGEWQTIFNTSFWPIFTNVIMLQLGFSSNKNVDIKFSAHDAFLE
jgi:hypothetical protein